ncbi:MAG: hypothetical protein K5898_01035 [Ruminococcus sp.]|uniref:hypothetical protein n=1 Tax=Ruminococcus sp. TaxID=41978 RepID=UPI0025D9668C|nr:hypothetical protein [Ruminococcus sp.]MCR4793766.1 hypothetical protein [Ruminococcus sp.]
MREYDQMTLKVANRIFEKGDAILEQRQKRSAKIRHITYAVSGLCAVLIVCFGTWKLLPSLKPHNSFKDSDIVITTATTAAENTTEAVTENMTSAQTASAVTTAKTTAKATETTTVTMKDPALGTVAVRTTAVSYTATKSTAALTSARRTQTSVYTNTTTNAMTSKTATGVEESIIITTTAGHIAESWNPATTSLDGSPVTTSKTSIKIATITTTKTTACDLPVTTTTVITTKPEGPVSFSIQEMFLSRPVSVRIGDIRYDREVTETSTTIGGAHKSIPVNRIGNFIRNGSVNIYVDRNFLIIESMEVYEIKNVPPEKAVAVRLKNTDEYYMFKNYDYNEDDDS